MFLQATANSIAGAIDSHIAANGGSHAAWYVGIASDPNDRLLNGHNANSQNNAARFWDAQNDETARAVEQHFFKKGCKGGPGGGDSSTRYVYAYRITNSTVE